MLILSDTGEWGPSSSAGRIRRNQYLVELIKHPIESFSATTSLPLNSVRNGKEYGGDFARTILVEGGEPLPDPKVAKNAEWRDGVLAEEQLHADLVALATPSMTFEELHTQMNARISKLGFENIDFLGNLGHSIKRDGADRLYIEPGNTLRLDEVDLSTFEPHIRRPNGA